MMSPSEIGSLNQLTSIATLLSSTFIAPVSTYVGRGFLEWQDNGTLTIKLYRFIKFVGLASALLAAILWGIDSSIDVISGIKPGWAVLLVGIYLVAFSIYTITTSGLIILGRSFQYAVVASIATWAGFAMALVFFRYCGKPEGWQLGIYSGFVLSSAAFFLLIKAIPERRGLTGGKEHHIEFSIKRVFLFAWPQVIVYILWWIQSQSYRFILDGLTGLASVGLFFAAYTICSMPMQTFETLFNEFYSPILYRKLKGQSQAGMAQVWNDYASAYVPAVIIFGAFLIGSGPYLAKVLLGEKFQAVGYIIVWPALAETFRAISSSLYTMGIIKVDMRINILPVVAGAVTALLLVYQLAQRDPLIGTGVALFLASAVVLSVVVPISRRVLPIKWPMRRIGLAVVFGSPLIAGGYSIAKANMSIGLATASVMIILTATYLVIVQYLIARKWLRSTHPFARGNAS